MSEMTKERLEVGGTLLYGATSWQNQLARDLDVSELTMRRWKTGQVAIRPGVLDELARLCLDRAGDEGCRHPR